MSLLAVSTLTVAGGALAEGGVTVDLDLTLFVQLGFFLVLLFVLKPTLFDPMMRLFEEREKRIEGTRHEATKQDKRSAKALATVEAALAKAREAGMAERDRIRAEGLKREATIMSEVRAEVSATLERGRHEIAEEAKAARTRLEAEARALGRDAATRALGREITS
jgi:F-type H+-transporting ATPase subunit b